MSNFYNDLITEERFVAKQVFRHLSDLSSVKIPAKEIKQGIKSSTSTKIPADKVGEESKQLVSSVSTKKFPSSEEISHYIATHPTRAIGGIFGAGVGSGAGMYGYEKYKQAKKAAEEQEAARKAAEESKGVFQRGIDKAKEYGDKVLLLLLDLVLLLLERNLLLKRRNK